LIFLHFFRHIGDLGNIGCDMTGEIEHHLTDDHISLHGKDSIIGRSIAVGRSKMLYMILDWSVVLSVAKVHLKKLGKRRPD
jgi:hypothetical protein